MNDVEKNYFRLSYLLLILNLLSSHIKLLKTKVKMNYISNIQSLPRSKHSPSRLRKPVSAVQRSMQNTQMYTVGRK
jgi:hypothetical protein